MFLGLYLHLCIFYKYFINYLKNILIKKKIKTKINTKIKALLLLTKNFFYIFLSISKLILFFTKIDEKIYIKFLSSTRL